MNTNQNNYSKDMFYKKNKNSLLSSVSDFNDNFKRLDDPPQFGYTDKNKIEIRDEDEEKTIFLFKDDIKRKNKKNFCKKK